jgi:hypothetical protein
MTAPAATIGQLWRTAGGGTAGFSPRAFSELLTSQRWTAPDRCGLAACGASPPHLCWWSAIGAAVVEMRHHRPTAKPPIRAETTLF